MNWMDKHCRANVCVTIGRRKISRLLLVDDLVLLASFEFVLQYILNAFATAYEIAEMKINKSKTEVHFSRNSVLNFLEIQFNVLCKSAMYY